MARKRSATTALRHKGTPSGTQNYVKELITKFTAMKKNILYFFFILAPLCFIIMGTNDPQSTGAPPSSTGAPGETTCAKSGCHTGQNVNSGAGITSFTFSNNLETYFPGETYPITISIMQDSINRFGFECVVVANNDSSNAGTFIITDAARTQVFPGSDQFEGREYLTYTYDGTNPYTDGVGEWSFEWTAPATDVGPVTFYIATVAANNDATDKGDLVYTKTVEITKDIAAGIYDEHKDKTILNCYPNPATEFINIEFANETTNILELSLVDITGKVLYSESNIRELKKYTINLEKLGITQGIYFIQLETNQATSMQKIVIAK
ncbi:MAG: T9SS type A sorting domain-containing protein [Bacteroidia bacterium]|nr:T9SS type A sorting domain-containing protein [Bacteroidia bacterium]